jgi:hypothetical protein
LEPLLISAGEGFTVSYRGRLLYSGRDPGRAVLRAVEGLQAREGDLVLCFSPLLCRGIPELAAKLPPSSALLLVEADPALFDFTLAHCPSPVRDDGRVFLLPPGAVNTGLRWLEQKRAGDFWGKPFPPPGTFRRVLRLDCSGGAGLSPSLYDSIERAFAQGVSQFWKNRATLMRLGRLFCRNLFLNLPSLPSARALGERTLRRPILVAGSGPSLDTTLTLPPALLKALFIIAVDTALPAFLARGIRPDLAAQVEAQAAIEAAYIGAPDLPVAADLLSRRRRADYYFFSAFTAASFVDRLGDAGLLPVEIPPLGSVALAAVDLALRLRREGTPVFVSGMDFSFPPGRTHCKGSPAHTSRLLGWTRLSGEGDFSAAFRDGAGRADTKDGSRAITDPALLGYRDLFAARFGNTPALFDAGEGGLPLGIPRVTTEALAGYAGAVLAGGDNLAAGAGVETGGASPGAGTDPRRPSPEAVSAFLAGERDALVELRGLLRGEGDLAGAERERRVLSLLEEREYLYLHFPDGYRVSPSPSFLKRARAEIDFFLKYIGLALKSTVSGAL